MAQCGHGFIIAADKCYGKCLITSLPDDPLSEISAGKVGAQPLEGADVEAGSDQPHVSPEAAASLWSTVTFGWMSPLMVKARLPSVCIS